MGIGHGCDSLSDCMSSCLCVCMFLYLCLYVCVYMSGVQFEAGLTGERETVWSEVTGGRGQSSTFHSRASWNADSTAADVCQVCFPLLVSVCFLFLTCSLCCFFFVCMLLPSTSIDWCFKRSLPVIVTLFQLHWLLLYRSLPVIVTHFHVHFPRPLSGALKVRFQLSSHF